MQLLDHGVGLREQPTCAYRVMGYQRLEQLSACCAESAGLSDLVPIALTLMQRSLADDPRYSSAAVGLLPVADALCRALSVGCYLAPVT